MTKLKKTDSISLPIAAGVRYFGKFVRNKFKKARLKFARKRVYCFTLSGATCDLDYFQSGRRIISHHDQACKEYQALEKIMECQFSYAFWIARKLAIENSEWEFSYVKIEPLPKTQRIS